MSALRGIDWYVQTARLRATTIVEDVRWFAVFDPEHPHSHDGNQLVVHQSTEIDLASVADESRPSRTSRCPRSSICRGPGSGAPTS
jgi:hypothetical protein